MAVDENRLKKLRTLINGDSEDNSQDELLEILIGYAESRFLLILRRVTKVLGIELAVAIPDDLDWITEEVVVRRFNRIGSEGMKSESVEGHSVQFESNDFADYIELVEDYYGEVLIPDTQGGKYGSVVGYL